MVGTRVIVGTGSVAGVGTHATGTVVTASISTGSEASSHSPKSTGTKSLTTIPLIDNKEASKGAVD